MTRATSRTVQPADTVKNDLLARSLERRATLAQNPEHTAYRLINREADGFPGLALDRFGPVLVANLYDGRPAPLDVLAAAQSWTGAEAVYVKERPAQASRLSAAQREKLAPPTPALGLARTEIDVHENGATYEIRPGAGLSVGLFLDMREVRAAVRARTQGARVLNCFAYTCAFGVAATLGGAAEAVNVDVSQSVLGWGQRNYARNGLETRREDFVFGDVFDWLVRFARRGRQFDFVIVDPPPYATTRHSRFSITRDLAGLIAKAAACVAPGGRLLVCANAAELSSAAFAQALREGLPERRHVVSQRWNEPELDFPRRPGTQPYLKVALLSL